MTITITQTGAGTTTVSVNVQPSSFSYIAGEAMLANQAIYIGADTKAYKAKANSMTTMPSVGIAQNDALLGEIVQVLEEGETTVLREADFTPGNVVWVSPLTAGKLTDTVPSAISEFVQVMGVAKSTSSVALQIDHTVIQVQS